MVLNLNLGYHMLQYCVALGFLYGIESACGWEYVHTLPRVAYCKHAIEKWMVVKAQEQGYSISLVSFPGLPTFWFLVSFPGLPTFQFLVTFLGLPTFQFLPYWEQ